VEEHLREYYNDYIFPLKIEVTSLSQQNSVHYSRGFMQLTLLAFDRHYPLILRPDDIWLVLTSSFSAHIHKNSEALRHLFVSHEGKKILRVNADSFQMGQMPPSAWEEQIFPDFSNQIRGYIGDKIHRILASPFSTSTVTDIAAHEISLMSAMKEYFDYSMDTLCGIPWVELQGTLEDWKALRSRAEEMCSLMIPDAGKNWWHVLGPVLDEFILSYSGQVNHRFWQSICKSFKVGEGSGAYQAISGWVTLLYLYQAEFHKPWQELNPSDGPTIGSFSPIMVSAPVTWKYYDEIFDLQFHAGYFGILQDSETRALQARIGWVVTHDPPISRDKRLIALEKLKSELIAGKNDPKDWLFKRIKTEIEKLTNEK
jgi:hypothetical protein